MDLLHIFEIIFIDKIVLKEVFTLFYVCFAGSLEQRIEIVMVSVVRVGRCAVVLCFVCGVCQAGHVIRRHFSIGYNHLTCIYLHNLVIFCDTKFVSLRVSEFFQIILINIVYFLSYFREYLYIWKCICIYSKENTFEVIFKLAILAVHAQIDRPPQG